MSSHLKSIVLITIIGSILILVRLESSSHLCPERYTLSNSAQQARIPYCTTHDIDTPNADIEHIIITLHGVDDAPRRYFEEIVSLANQTQRQQNSLIIAPHFVRSAAIYPSESHLLRWLDDGWDYQWGQDASNTDEALASYDVMDDLLLHLVQGQFPNLQTMVLVGFSGGGQYVNRYAALNSLEPLLNERDITLRYIIANPGSYLYYDSRRPVDGQIDEFEVPSGLAVLNCPTWDDYGIGMRHRYRYAQQIPPETALHQYLARDVYYLIGDQDLMTGFDCRHQFEGETRYERALVYFHYVATFQDNDHQLAIVPDIGHDLRVYHHPCALLWLFGTLSDNPCTPYQRQKPAEEHQPLA